MSGAQKRAEVREKKNRPANFRRAEHERSSDHLCGLWHSPHLILLSALVTAFSSLASVALYAALVFSSYFLVSVFQDSSSPFLGLFLPRFSPKKASVLAYSFASSHFPSFAAALILSM